MILLSLFIAMLFSRKFGQKKNAGCPQ